MFIVAPPLILNKAPIIIAILGEAFSVKCVVSGGPKPRVYWKHMDDDIIQSIHLWVCSSTQLNKYKIMLIIKYNPITISSCFRGNLFRAKVYLFSCVNVMSLKGLLCNHFHNIFVSYY